MLISDNSVKMSEIDNNKKNYDFTNFCGLFVHTSLLPKIELLDGDMIEGTVVHVSSDGLVWFCPKFMQEKLVKMADDLDFAYENQKLSNVPEKMIFLGMICIVRSKKDSNLYRAEVLGYSSSRVLVKYIDFGDKETVSLIDIYAMPYGFELSAPASFGLNVGRKLPLRGTKNILTKYLMQVIQN